MALILLALVTTLAVAASLVVVIRARLAGRAEAVVAGTLFWCLLVTVPVYGLGLLGCLTASTLAVTSAVVSLAVIGISMRRADRRQLLTACLDMLRGIVRLPWDAIVIAGRARSPVLPGLVAALLLVGYMTVAAYLSPEIGYWDALWYHQPIVGFTIQNHGFAAVELPDTLEKINGYPRLAEMTQLWFAIFAGRRLIDIANLPFVPALAASVYLLSRRAGATVVIALGWASAIVLWPAVGRIMQSSYVDVQNAAVLLGAIVFATRAPLRSRDGLIASVGLTLAVGSKFLSLVPVAVVGAMTAVRLLWRRGQWPSRGSLATVAVGLAMLAAMLAAVYLRNLLLFHNPFWPDLSVNVPALGIHWPGLLPWSPLPNNPNAWRINMNEPVARLIGQLLSLPFSIKETYFDQTVDYAMGFGWIVLPLTLMSALVWAWACARRLLRREEAGGHATIDLVFPGLLLLVLAAIVFASPALWCPRYHIVTVGLMMTMVAWLGARGLERAIEAAVAAVLIMSLITMWWTPAPSWLPAPERLAELARRTSAQREVLHELGAPVSTEVGLKRNNELGAGTILAFNERYGGLPAVFWNDDFSNRVVYLKGGPDFLARAAARGATWVFLTDQDPALALARSPASGWQEVGVLNAVNGGRAFRRLRPASP